MKETSTAIVQERWTHALTAQNWHDIAEKTVAAQESVWLEAFSHLLGDAPRVALDVGTGAGFLALLLAKLGHQVTGLDLSEEMLARARSRSQKQGQTCTWLQGNADDLPFHSEAFEIVVSRHVLPFLPRPSKAMHEWGRVLQPAGKLLLISHERSHSSPLRVARNSALGWLRILQRRIYFPSGYHDALSRFPFSRAKIGQIVALMEAAGLENITVTPLSPWLGKHSDLVGITGQKGIPSLNEGMA